MEKCIRPLKLREQQQQSFRRGAAAAVVAELEKRTSNFVQTLTTTTENVEHHVCYHKNTHPFYMNKENLNLCNVTRMYCMHFSLCARKISLGFLGVS